jgi:two-component system sensor histidine kinase PilS (NtrC family)
MTAKESTPTPLAAGATRAESRAAVETENWKLLQYFNYFRLAAGLAASSVALTWGTLPPLGQARPALFLSTSLTYTVLGLIAAFTIRARKPDFDTHAVLLSFADITLLTMLMHSSGGLASGVGLLLIAAIGGASLMLGRKLTLFYASLAAIAALLEQGWELIHDAVAGVSIAGTDSLQGFPIAGLFGVGLYATAFVGQSLATRLRATEALAERRGVDAANLAQMSELIIQRMQSGVMVCEASGQVRKANEAAVKYLGIPAGVAGKTNVNEISPDLAAQLVQWLGSAAGEQRAPKIFRSQAGYTLLPRFMPVGDTDARKSGSLGRRSPVAGVVVFLDDMVVLKKQAQELKMSALARLTASIAHEIRNPLGALSNAAQLLSESSGSEAEQKRLLKIIDEQTRRMNVIVQNVTQLSRRDRVNATRMVLDHWLKDFVRQYCETLFVPQGTFAVVCPDGLSLCADSDQIHQVVTNLCQNALRHSPPFTGTPLLKLQGSTDKDGRPCLDVIDWGSGVPPEVADSIFDPFFTTSPKGTGLGLYIARELCEGNGGSLDYFPGDGGVGSRFRVTFARAEECSESIAI